MRQTFVTAALFFVPILAHAQDQPQTPPALTAQLNPAFKITGAQVQALMAEGKAAADHHLSQQDFNKTYTQKFHWTRGKGAGNTDGSFVQCFTFGGGEIALRAYRAATLYQPSPIPTSIQQQGMYLKYIGMVVVLGSFPEFKRREGREHLTPSDIGDVSARRFVVVDDKGNIVEAEPDSTSGTDASGQEEYFRGISKKSSLPFFMMRYEPRFPLFGSDGKPLLAFDAHKLTLHVITDAGEQSAEFKVEPLK